MRSRTLILVAILVICSSLFFGGCSRKGNEEISYEIVSFESAPKEVQAEIIEVDKWIREKERMADNDHPYKTISSSGSVNLGKERYGYVITNNQIPKIIEIVSNDAYGSGIMIKHTSEYKESIEFPTTVTIVKLNDYSGKISYVYISHPQDNL